MSAASDAIALSYDVSALPTAQHRAGLAGLLVLVDSLRRRNRGPLPDWSPSGGDSVAVTLTRETLQTLFDDVYDAFWEVRSSGTKPSGKSFRNLREVVVEDDGSGDESAARKKDRKRFEWEAVAPKAAFLDPYLKQEAWAWQKLWREAVWATLRGVPKTRGPYEERANDQRVRLAQDVWAMLVRWQGAKARGRYYTAGLSSALLVGAQDTNAEQVPFVGAAPDNLLLHFWPVVMGVGEAHRMKVDQGRVVEEATGFVLAVPDVADIEGFLEDFPGRVAGLGTSLAGFRPREAILSIPQEGALEYLHHLLSLAQGKARRQAIALNVSGVEVYHLAKQGNNIAVLGSGRVAADRALVEAYDGVRGLYRHPLFRAQIIRNLLRRQPWYAGFDRVFDTQPLELFFDGGAARFGNDVGRRFNAAYQEAQGR